MTVYCKEQEIVHRYMIVHDIIGKCKRQKRNSLIWFLVWHMAEW